MLAGTSLGANTALEAAAAHPERVRGMVVEMPVLDNALLGCAIAFTPLMCALTFGEPVMKGVSWATRAAADRRASGAPTSCSTPSARTPGRAPPCCRACSSGASRRTATIRRTIAAPALVIGHHRDPVHPFSDSDALVAELPDARLLRADSILELRAHARAPDGRDRATSSTSAGSRAAGRAPRGGRRVARR